MFNSDHDDEIARAHAEALLATSDLKKENIQRALASNEQYLKVVERHLTAIENMLEANMEKKVRFCMCFAYHPLRVI